MNAYEWNKNIQANLMNSVKKMCRSYFRINEKQEIFLHMRKQNLFLLQYFYNKLELIFVQLWHYFEHIFSQIICMSGNYYTSVWILNLSRLKMKNNFNCNKVISITIQIFNCPENNLTKQNILRVLLTFLQAKYYSFFCLQF